MQKLHGLCARYEMSSFAFEKLLENVGWLKNGELVESKYMKAGEVTPRGLGYLDGMKGPAR